MNKYFLLLCVLFVGCSSVGGGIASEFTGGVGPGQTPPLSGEPTGDKFDDVGTNPFTLASHDPFSTFGADVDTASYDIFVRDVGELATRPQPASVRIEEWINSFDYEYTTPAPTAEQPFAVDLELADNPFTEGITRLRVGIQAKARESVKKISTNLVFLVDISGSMASSTKLPLVQRVLREAVAKLDPNDRVSIVTYAGDTRVALPSTPATDIAEIEDAIDDFDAGGSTNGEGGINLAYAEAQAGFIEGGFNHVIICTDGDFNVGASGNQELLDLIRSKRDSGITLTALGFGAGNLNDSMMELVSNSGNGIYSVIASEEHAVRYAQEKLLDTAQHVAKDVKLQVEFNPAHVMAYRLVGYENRDIPDDQFRDDLVDGGEIGAGHQVTALYDVVLAEQMIPVVEDAPAVLTGEPVDGQREVASEDLVEVRIRWKKVTESDADAAQEVSASLTPEDRKAAAEMSASTRWASAVAAFAEIMKKSPYADPAQASLIQAEVLSQKDADRDRSEFSDLMSKAMLLPAL